MLLLQALAQPLPPINVTVQSPPGNPFWQTAIISAVIGTFFGFASSIGMEFVKPWIARRLHKRTILRHLDEEFRSHYASLLDILELAKEFHTGTSEVKEMALTFLRSLSPGISTDRYDHFRETEKALFYEADEGYTLGKFYVLFREGMKDFPNKEWALAVAVGMGGEYIKKRGMSEIKPMGAFTDAFQILQKHKHT
jgi:hypothetical protein